MGFRTAEPALKDVLDAIAKGESQLPDTVPGRQNQTRLE